MLDFCLTDAEDAANASTAAHYEKLLESTLADPVASFSQLPIMEQREFTETSGMELAAYVAFKDAFTGNDPEHMRDALGKGNN